MKDVESHMVADSSKRETTEVPGASGNRPGYTEFVAENVDDLKRDLSSRQIQMMTIGGTIGTALFVSIGWGLIQGGPGSLLIGFLLYASFMACVNSCMAEVSGTR